MTEQRALSDEELAEAIGAAVDARPGLTDAEALAMARALAVPCRGCLEPAGRVCVRGTDGQPLERFVAHPQRLADGGARLGDTDPRFLAGGATHCRRDDCDRCRRGPKYAGHGYPVPEDPAAEQGWYRP